MDEKPEASSIDAVESSAQGFLSSLTSNPLVSPLLDTYDSISSRRKALGLPFPGTAEGLQKEVKGEARQGKARQSKKGRGREEGQGKQRVVDRSVMVDG